MRGDSAMANENPFEKQNVFKRIVTSLIGERIHDTRVMPLATKIIIIFTIFILASNFASNLSS